MARIHVGLDLEDESREGRLHRIHRSGGALAGRRGRRQGEEALQEHVDPVVGECAPETDRAGLSPGDGVVIGLGPRDLDELHFLAQTFGARLTEYGHQLGRVQIDEGGLGAGLAVVVGLLVQPYLGPLAIVDTDELAVLAYRPGRDEALDAQLGLDVVEELEGVGAGRTCSRT